MIDWQSRIPKELENEILISVYEPGDLILSEGDKGDKVCFLISGQTKMYITSLNGQVHIQNIVAAPEAFGMIELFKNLNNACTVEAYTKVKVMIVYRDAFMRWLKLDHDFALDMLTRISDIAYRQIDEQSKSMLYPLKYRFISQVISECDLKKSDTLVFDKQIMAQRLATTVRHLNRTINTCVEKKLITYSDGKLKVLDFKALRAYKDV
ncbi:MULTISPECIES: Crp/Fnr family transcriptional regulator [unclassified Fusibacter]|uniref:Crp/Fnr family transcriptional regulator n=1 Tax=unclassified Fusibacter TaxID=2624464 RepID=UPI001013A7D3|nr:MULTISPECIES: Crp/Fnr family transcriptional regulator [unclassified Fusibacter]MCK8061209.1 Crp/Fnr family transcriptional regulator [Fusibacter sp. A2]NPE23447.1 Crp/Fnr family transcriptional regulator [Fusibacter sp. A1]RXV59226.1 Crp/Fnr family transcriptional regulator [Fusibacter sp. A1]